jgi:hypothetical protein
LTDQDQLQATQQPRQNAGGLQPTNILGGAGANKPDAGGGAVGWLYTIANRLTSGVLRGTVTANQGTAAANTAPWPLTQAAAGVGVKNVCMGLTAVVYCGAVAGTAAIVQVFVRDGASGAGTILWAANLVVPSAANQVSQVIVTGLWLVGSPNTALTVEFNGAPGANASEIVTAFGTTTG